MARVLVIEDELANMKLTVLLLSKEGHSVLQAIDAETGLMLARSLQPDLILMDFQLPGMDGFAATALLKKDPVTAAIPVIALSATAMESIRQKSRLSGCDAYLSKPLRYKELYAAINALLNTARPANRADEFDHQPDMNRSPDISQSSIDPSLNSHDAALPQVNSPQVVDLGVLENLIGNDPVLITEFLDIFRISATKIAREIRTACMELQPMLASSHAHKLKASAQMAGALALGVLCSRMEIAGKAGDTGTLMMLLPKFEQEIVAVNAFLDSFQAAQALLRNAAPSPHLPESEQTKGQR